MKYTVLRATKEGGLVYTIAPVDDQTKTRWIHRTMLKAVEGADSDDCASFCSMPLVADPTLEDDCLIMIYLFSDGHHWQLLPPCLPPALPT